MAMFAVIMATTGVWTCVAVAGEILKCAVITVITEMLMRVAIRGMKEVSETVAIVVMKERAMYVVSTKAIIVAKAWAMAASIRAGEACKRQIRKTVTGGVPGAVDDAVDNKVAEKQKMVYDESERSDDSMRASGGYQER